MKAICPDSICSQTGCRHKVPHNRIDSCTKEERGNIINGCKEPCASVGIRSEPMSLNKLPPVLTDEKRTRIINKAARDNVGILVAELRMLQAQRADTVLKMIEWGLEICPHWADESTKEVGIMKRDCSLCWQELKDMVDKK